MRKRSRGGVLYYRRLRKATPKFRVIEQMGSIAPEVPKGRTSTLLIYSARSRGYDQVMTNLVDSGASKFFVKLAALKKSTASYEFLCLNVKREEVIFRLANSALIKIGGNYT